MSLKILIKGAGDLATGIAVRLYRAGYTIWMTDLKSPTAVRRTVSFSRCIYEGTAEVEGITAEYALTADEGMQISKKGRIAVFADPQAKIIKEYKPDVLIDAIIAKSNIGTSIDDAPFVIAAGPGFTAGIDCHAVIETKRGHTLGSVITSGSAIANTGVPGNIGGYTTERIIRAAADGIFEPIAEIGSRVNKGDAVAKSGNITIYAQLDGIVRGMLRDGTEVFKGMKCGDIDPRCEKDNCFTVSDKARAIGGGALEAVCGYEHGTYPACSGEFSTIREK